MKKALIVVALVVLAVGLYGLFEAQSESQEQLPGDCALLQTATLQRSQNPPASLAGFDAVLHTMETKAVQHAALPLFAHEAANRRLQRFQALRQLEDLQRAERYTASQLQSNPKDRLALARHASLSMARHEFKAALAAATDAGALALQHDALEELGQFDAAAKALAQLPVRGLGNQLRRARAADRQGQAELALEHLEQAIGQARKSSLHPLTLAGLLSQQGTLALHNQRYDLACARYTEALALQPQQAVTLAWLGRWAWYAGKPQVAIAFLQRATELDDISADFPALLAQMADDPARRKEAQAQAVSRYSRWPQWYRLKSAADLAAAGQTPEAMNLLNQEAQQRQGREYLSAALAVFALAGQPDEALQALQGLQAHGILHPPQAWLAWSYWMSAGDRAQADRLISVIRKGRVELTPSQWARFVASNP